jgi:hypothetical protein
MGLTPNMGWTVYSNTLLFEQLVLELHGDDSDSILTYY